MRHYFGDMRKKYLTSAGRYCSVDITTEPEHFASESDLTESQCKTASLPRSNKSFFRRKHLFQQHDDDNDKEEKDRLSLLFRRTVSERDLDTQRMENRTFKRMTFIEVIIADLWSQRSIFFYCDDDHKTDLQKL